MLKSVLACSTMHKLAKKSKTTVDTFDGFI